MSSYVSVSHLWVGGDEAPGVIYAFRQRSHLVDSASELRRLGNVTSDDTVAG